MTTASGSALLPTTRSNNAGRRGTGDELGRAARLLGEHAGGRRGAFAYAAFDWVNAALFAGELPTPLVLWTITAYGQCLGLTAALSPSAPPIVALHPALLAPVKENPWGVPTALLGPRLALDVLIHECLHVAVARLRGGRTGETSHNDPAWVAEVNRIAPLLGFQDFPAGSKRVKRVAVEGQLTKTGRPLTRVTRVSGERRIRGRRGRDGPSALMRVRRLPVGADQDLLPVWRAGPARPRRGGEPVPRSAG